MFVLLPALVLMEITSHDQKYNAMDILKMPSRILTLDEAYFWMLMLPLLVYMPGDAAILTLASYDKPSHNPIVIGVSCFAAKWFVAYLFLHIIYYAEGLAPDPQGRCTQTGIRWEILLLIRLRLLLIGVLFLFVAMKRKLWLFLGAAFSIVEGHETMRNLPLDCTLVCPFTSRISASVKQTL